jgi:hypothetical protein
MKDLIITPMYFHETNGQIGQIKCKSKYQCITNLMKPSHTINTRMSNEYSIERASANYITIGEM